MQLGSTIRCDSMHAHLDLEVQVRAALDLGPEHGAALAHEVAVDDGDHVAGLLVLRRHLCAADAQC